VYSALETHLIDGAENNICSYEASRHFEAARYFSLSQHSHAPDVLLISKKRFLGLSKTDQQLLRELARASVGVMRGLWDSLETSAREKVQAGGVQFVDVDHAAFRTASEPLVKRYRADAELEALYQSIRKAA
jgi:TRAP-type C4-dicarboxylate transport system substrate-binding protein